MIGFKQCPYPYDRYAINEYDLALDLKTGEVIVPCIGENSKYPGWSLVKTGETKTKTVHVHRLKAYTFLENNTGLPFEDCQVDHLDGDKLNSYLGNLEIVIPQENKARAYRTGLRKDNNRVLLVNLTTKEEHDCYSQAEAARVLGIGAPRLCEVFSKFGNDFVYRNYHVKRML
ncbi:HNH endonuclease [uncultured Holdemanella sp.]|jgi:hypothetical protein|uniref:HNH endonuclease n=1 Tax=uncultured Holdemanella sp. TaxID=1763549 RepID=UPI0025F1FD86|nr:HNH endonuclease [uncultured Holdemanella sp.]